MSNTFDKLSVLDSFIEEVNSYLPDIEANLERLTQSPGDMEALEETYRRTHTIGGSASMMDFPGLAQVAQGMEDILGDVLDGLSTLDLPTIGLLQRSLARLYRLVAGIQHGIDEQAVIAEDDEDYAQYRAQMDAATQGVQGGMITPEYVAPQYPSAPTPAQPQYPAAHSPVPGEYLYQADNPIGPTLTFPEPESAGTPSLNEMLASFRTPAANAGEVAWPEEPVLRAEFPPRPEVQYPVPPMQPAQHAQFDLAPAPPPVPPMPAPSSPSALELLANAKSPALPSSSAMPLTPRPTLAEPPASPASPAPYTVYSAPAPVVPPMASSPTPARRDAAPPMQASPTQVRTAAPDLTTSLETTGHRPESRKPTHASAPQFLQDMRNQAQALADQTSAFRRTLGQLRVAATVVENQRAEFKSFLDGSRDALDRMEEWAGKAMGLNLRNSPEQVRRYLPLSVMWVANSKLKKILDMLLQMANGVEGTDEQIQWLLQQWQESLTLYSEIVQQQSPSLPQGDGWSSWEIRSEVQTGRGVPRERVTFERQGDIQALRAEIEAEVRQELAAQAEPQIDRAELERRIRAEVRDEFRNRLQSQVSGTLETVEEIEDRLRKDIEIEVRNELLQQLHASSGNASAALMNLSPAATSEATPVQEAPTARVAPPLPPLRPTQPVTPPPMNANASMGGDFGDEAAEIFRLEAEEHLQTISMHVAALEHAPTNLEPIQGIRRATHTLKGAAGMMGFRAIADLCHVSEDMLDGIMEGGIAISPTVLSLILDTAEALDLLINGKGVTAEGEEAVQSLHVRYAELLGDHHDHLDALPEEEIEEEPVPSRHVPVNSSLDQESRPPEASMPGAASTDLSVRVSLSKLDELVNLFGELLVNRTILEERIQRLNRLVADTGVSSNRLRDVGQRLESRFEAATLPSGRSLQVMPGEGNTALSRHADGTTGNRFNRAEPAHLADFDVLELDRYTEFHQLARGLSEGISDMTTLSAEMETVIRDCEGVFSRESRLSTTFQDRLMKARLVPLSTMIPRLYRTARAVALKQHKEFELVLEGQETEVDRTVIEEIAGPLLHLMRNAVNHALETPEVRQQRGKPSAGVITLKAVYEGNQVVITVRDDGIGLDPARIRNEAIRRGLIAPDQTLSDNEIVELIFRPGFSTAEVLSEESGRGVGLDVVRDSVARLRGTMEVESMPGQGTAFTMRFPTSLAIQNAMMVQLGDQQFAIPTVMVEAIGRLDNYKRSTYGGRPAILVQNQPYPLSSLAQLLGLPPSELSDKAPLLLVRTDRSRVALVVDDIKGRMDVVMKNLGPHLRNVYGVAGGTVLGNGRVVLILELPDLLAARNAGVRGAVVATAPAEAPEASARPAVQVERRTMIAPIPPTPTAKATPSAPQGKHILVVDDSPSVRRVVSNMLKQHQWEVQTARDGVEALEMISQETPAAVLLDIEMPRMDGYELMATVRAQEQYRTLPLVVLTSRAATKHQQRAMQLGANAYVVKPYQDEELINILNLLVYGAAA